MSASTPRATAFRCPTCNATALPRSVNRAYPFCSERCRTVDLGRWMASQYALDPQSGALEIIDPLEAEEVPRGDGDGDR